MRKNLNIYSKEEELKISVLMDLSEYKRGHCALLHLLDNKDSDWLTKILILLRMTYFYTSFLRAGTRTLQCRFTILSKN